MTWDQVEQMIRELQLPDDVQTHGLAWVSSEKQNGTTCPTFRRFDYDYWGWRLSWEDEQGARETVHRLIDPHNERSWPPRYVMQKAIEAIGSEAEAQAWMKRPSTGLENRRPIDVMQEIGGLERVFEYLVRIETGTHT